MSNSSNQGDNRSIHIGGNASQNIIQTGDQNIAFAHYEPVTLPTPERVNIKEELAALRDILAGLDTPDKRKIKNALSDAGEELTKDEPEKDEIGKALDRAFDYAQKAEGFVDIIEKLKPHVTKAASWLGENWHKILGIVGLTV